MQYIDVLKNKLNSFINYKYFNEIYCAMVTLMALLGFITSPIVGMLLLLISGIIILLLTDNLNYILPQILMFLFSSGQNYDDSTAKVTLLVCITIFMITIIYYLIKNKINIKKMSSLYPIVGLAIFNILPIFWCKNLSDNQGLYIYFFSNLFYLIFYFVVSACIKGDAINIFIKAMSYLLVLVFFEVLIKFIMLNEGIIGLDSYFQLGFIASNEAGVIIVMCLPFVFYELSKMVNFKQMIIPLIKLIVGLIGIILCSFANALFFGLITFVVCLVILLFKSSNKKLYKIVFIMMVVIMIALLYTFYNSNIFGDVINSVFNNKYRNLVWYQADKTISENVFKIIFGPGVCANVLVNENFEVVPLLYQNAFLQTICTTGIVGFICLGYHMVYKYKALNTIDKNFFMIMLFSTIILDCYGMVENTYLMSYFMIPLYMLLAVLDNRCYLNNINILSE